MRFVRSAVAATPRAVWPLLLLAASSWIRSLPWTRQDARASLRTRKNRSGSRPTASRPAPLVPPAPQQLQRESRRLPRSTRMAALRFGLEMTNFCHEPPPVQPVVSLFHSEPPAAWAAAAKSTVFIVAAAPRVTAFCFVLTRRSMERAKLMQSSRSIVCLQCTAAAGRNQPSCLLCLCPSD